MSAPPPPPPPLSALPSANWAVPNVHRMNPWPVIVGIGRMLGLVLLFLGTLIAVAFASVPSSCFPAPSGCSGYPGTAASALMVGKILWVLGLFCIGAASGIRLQGNWFGGAGLGPEAGDAAVLRFRSNLTVLLVSVVLLFILLLTINFPVVGL
jgi:hypothetical protein